MMNISRIRNYLATRVGDKIIIICNGNRNRNERYSGILYRVYRNIFAVKISNDEIKCYNYVDIFTKNIQIYI